MLQLKEKKNPRKHTCIGPNVVQEATPVGRRMAPTALSLGEREGNYQGEGLARWIVNMGVVNCGPHPPPCLSLFGFGGESLFVSLALGRAVHRTEASDSFVSACT